MKLLEQIVSQLSFSLKAKLVKKLIKDLKKTSLNEEYSCLNEEYSCLDNVWEEYCIWTQDKSEVLRKKDYKTYIINLIEFRYKDLEVYEKIALWFETTDGIDWYYDKKYENFELEEIPYSFDPCAEDIYTMIESIALKFDNDNIYKFVNMSCDEFKDDYTEDDRELVYE